MQNGTSAGNFDVAVVGAGIIGCATARYLAKEGAKVAVIEREFPGSGSTFCCISGIRQQFSTAASIDLMRESLALFGGMSDEFGFGVDFHQGGYLLLAHQPELMQTFRKNVALQRSRGVEVFLLDPAEVSSLQPQLNTEGLIGAAFCPRDAQASPFLVIKGYQRLLRENRGEVFLYNPVDRIDRDRHFTLTLRDHTRIRSEKVLLSAGAWTGPLAAQLGVELPLAPERHEALITEKVPRFIEPMIVDYRRDGCYFQQLVTGQFIGCYTPHPPVPGIHHQASVEFLPSMARRMTRLIPRLSRLSVLRHWAGMYTMTPDGNPIVDQSKIEDLYIAAGMSGHGFMFGPAIGKYLSHFMLHGVWQKDFGEFAIDRQFTGAETLK